MSFSKRRLLMSIFRGNVSCGCDGAKLTDAVQPMPMPKPKTSSSATTVDRKSSTSSSLSLCHSSSTNSNAIDDEITTTANSSLAVGEASSHCSNERDDDRSRDEPARSSSAESGAVWKISDSVAVMKDSDDPYQDFRESMLLMIMEKELYSQSDLQELLRCFLRLNSPAHHETIVRAFTEIWNGVISGRTESTRKNPPHSHVKPDCLARAASM